MNNLNQYIIEKLKLNKNIKTEQNDKDYLVSEISYHIKHCLEDDYKISYNRYDINFIDNKKYITKNPKDTWYIELGLHDNSKKLSDNIANSLKIRLKDIIKEDNIQHYKIYDGKFIYKIFLYDPE